MKLLQIFGEGSTRSRKRSLKNGIRSIGTNTQEDTKSETFPDHHNSLEYHTDSEIVLACDSRSLRSVSPSSSSLKKSLKQRFSFRSVPSSSKKEFSRGKSRSLPPLSRKVSKQIDVKSIETLDIHPSLECRDHDGSDCASYMSAKSSCLSVEISENTLKGLEDTTFSSSSSTLEGEPLYLNGNIYIDEFNPSYLRTLDEVSERQWNHRSSAAIDTPTTPCSDDTLIADSEHSVVSQKSPYPRPQAPTPPSSEIVTPVKEEKSNTLNRLIGSFGSSFRNERTKACKSYASSQHSPGSSVQSGSGDSGVDTYETKCYLCTSCTMSFRTREQLCDHWKALHERESFIEMKETLERRRKILDTCGQNTRESDHFIQGV